jgi:hypothetical protein
MISFLSLSGAARSSRKIIAGCLATTPSRPQPLLAPLQRRWNWQIYLKQRQDKETGKLKYDDWNRVIMTMKEPTLVDGTSLQKRSWARKLHVKPTTRQKLINQRKTYRRQIKRIDDLTEYIKFMNDFKKN